MDSKLTDVTPQSPRRRSALQAGVAVAGIAAIGVPAIVRSEEDKVRIGHLTPMTGFLGALGEYAAMGVKLAAEEINAAGGALGRQLDVLSEDSVNPSVASSKAQRMLERDGAVVLLGEINSAAALTVSQVAARNQRLFVSTGARSDALRGKNCNRYTFYVDIPNTVMVNAVGQALLRDDLVRGRKFFSLTADYLFGHDLLGVAKKFFATNQGNFIGDELVATDVTDFSPYLLKIRQAQPDVVCSNLAGNQVSTFLKQYSEFGLGYPLIGFNLNTADAWAVGADNFNGIWPAVWHHELDTPPSKAFVAAFTKKYGKLPENHAWIEYVSLKILVQAINETKSTNAEKLAAYFEKGTEFELLKGRKGYFRSWDHQMMQEAYPFSAKPKGKAKEKNDFLAFGAAVPASSQPLELLATTKQENTCSM